jgi:heme exporter protein A
VSGGLEAVGLVRNFGKTRAVDDISFTLSRGETLALFGPNGAGKTTLLRVLAGALRAQGGEVRSGGQPFDPADLAWRSRVGLLSHRSFLYGRLTCAENLRFFGELYGLEDVNERVSERLRAVGLEDQADRHAQALSRGMTQRLALARALLHDPEIVLLDEPYTGLDAHAAGRLRGILAALKDGRRTVVLVTHNLTQGLRLADRIAIQVRGRFVHSSTDFERRPDSFEAFYRSTVEAA